MSQVSSGMKDSLLVLEMCPNGATSLVSLSRNEIYEKGQEKCREVFGSLHQAIRFRDLRLLVRETTTSDPVIVARMLSCIISLDRVRALLLWDRLYFFLPDGADEQIRLIRAKMYELQSGILDSGKGMVERAMSSSELSNYALIPEPGTHPGDLAKLASPKVSAGNLSMDPLDRQNSNASVPSNDNSNDFYLHALETMVWCAVVLLEKEYETLKPVIESITRRAKKDHHELTLEKLRQVRATGTRFLANANRHVAALTTISNNDHDMALMSFKHVLAKPERYREDVPETEWISHHDDIEVLLESYAQRLDSLISDLSFLIEQIERAEVNIAIDLDLARNRLLRLNLIVSVITVLAALGALVAGLFGMNLNSNIQETYDPPIFWIVSAITFFFVIFGSFAVLLLSRRFV